MRKKHRPAASCTPPTGDMSTITDARMPSRGPPCGCGPGPSVEGGKWYGVRSYLHLFSEDCAGAALRDDPEGPSMLCPRRLWPLVCWKFCLFLGTLLLMMGVAALATGYTVAPKLEGIGEGELLVLDQWAADYNRALGTCRLAGTALCTAAALLLAVCLFSAMTGWLSQHAEAEPLETEVDSHAGVSGDESEQQQLSPIFCDADGRPWFSPPARAFGQPSVQAAQPKWSS